MKLKLFFGFGFVAGTQVGVGQAIVRFFQQFIELGAGLFGSDGGGSDGSGAGGSEIGWFGTACDCLLILGDGAGKVFALGIENSQLQMGGGKLGIKAHGLQQQGFRAG